MGLSDALAVFTGSAAGSDAHRRSVQALARGLVDAGIGVVYGGGRVGLMGVLADTVLAAGGEVIGVMPQHLVDREIAHTGLTRLDAVAGMHERKARMADLADGFLALPGGSGTLEELFEVWTWGQLGLHHKPTAILDPDGFYTPLLDQLNQMTALGYLSAAHRDALGVVPDATRLLAFLRDYQHPTAKWQTTPPNGTPTRIDGDEPGLVSVGWVHRHEGQLLAVRTRGRDKFYLPGGKLEKGESPEQALAREVEEELGVTLSRLRPVFTVTAPAHGLGTPTQLTMHCYYATSTGQPEPHREIAEMTWLTIPDDPRAAPAVQQVLRRLAGHSADEEIGT